MLCRKRPLSLVLGLATQLAHRREHLFVGLLLLRVRLVLLGILRTLFEVVPRLVLLLMRGGPVAAQGEPVVDAVMLQVVRGLEALLVRLLNQRGLLLILELLLQELLVLLLGDEVTVARGVAEAVRERLHISRVAESFVVAGPGLSTVCPQHEAWVQLVGLGWRSCEVLGLDDEVVVGDLLLDGVDQVVLLKVRLAARLHRLSDHHAQALAVP